MSTDREQKVNEIWEFRDTIDNESDRGCALMAAAYLDVELARLFRAAFVDDPKVADNLFSHNGALGTFSSRIDLAYMMGYIGKKTHRDLHLIRKIRNEFAHHAKSIKFTDKQIASRCKQLYHTMAIRPSPRTQFINVAVCILGIIDGCLTTTNHTSLGIDMTDEGLNEIRSLSEFLEKEYEREAFSKEDIPKMISLYRNMNNSNS